MGSTASAVISHIHRRRKDMEVFFLSLVYTGTIFSTTLIAIGFLWMIFELYIDPDRHFNNLYNY